MKLPMGSHTQHPTTALERSVRISAIAAQADRDHLQALEGLQGAEN
jgi:hypothetical protein